MSRKIYLTLLQMLLLIMVIGGAWLLLSKGFGKLQPKPQAPSVPVRFEPKTLRKEAYQIKQELTRTNKTSGDLILEDNSDFRVTYLISNDEFIVDIKTTSYDLSKQKAEKWFRDKGFSAEELCILGISFVATKELKPDFSFKDATPADCPLPEIKPQD